MLRSSLSIAALSFIVLGATPNKPDQYSSFWKPTPGALTGSGKPTQQDFEQREQDALAKVQQNPTDGFQWFALGDARYRLHKYSEAIEPLQKAQEMGVSYPWDMRYYIACCEALAGRKEDALKSLEQAIDLGFRDLPQTRVDDDLKSLRDSRKYHDLVFDADTTKMDRVSGWRYDLKLYAREMKRLDYHLLHSDNREFDKAVSKLDASIPHLSDNQIAVGIQHLAAMGEDGHTSIRMHDPKGMVPVTILSFKEGFFITSAAPEQTDLLGSQVVAIDGHPIEEVFKTCSTVIGHENPQWPRVIAPNLMRRPKVLNGLGIAKSDQEITLTLSKDGNRRDVTLKANASAPDGNWKFARDLDSSPTPATYLRHEEFYWYEYRPESKTIYFQYDAVQNRKDKSIGDFAKEMYAFIESHDVDRMIMDIRWNGGGNNFLNQPLLLGLIKSKVNVKGKLFVITGPDTFSAAMCFATQLERYTNATFAGEPTGSSPNFVGESIPVTLPYSKLSGTISDLYWENSTAMDHRIWISPKIYVPRTFADYVGHKDPVIDAIMAYKG